jgi:hypothetical protein
MTPLPFTCQHEAYIPGVEDGYGNETPGWANAVDVPCFWWSDTSTEPRSAPSGGSLVAVDLCLVVDSSLAVDHRDVFVVEGKRFEVIGLPKDFDHGPWGYRPNRQVLELKWVG